jgi:hypothetical protein
MANARWSFGCTVFELATKTPLMSPPFVKGDCTSNTVKMWCSFHDILRARNRLSGRAGAVQGRVYILDLPYLRRILWNCCHPDPTKRKIRLEEEMKLWGTEWSTNTLLFHKEDVEIPPALRPE